LSIIFHGPFKAFGIPTRDCRKPLPLERLKKYWSHSAARNFSVLARLSEEVCPQGPVTERKRSQNPKGPLPLSPQPDGCSIFENALKEFAITAPFIFTTPGLPLFHQNVS
jgi:hypothetical protein